MPDGWLSDDNRSSPPPAKKKRLSLSLTKKARALHSTAVSTSWFAPPVTEVQFTEVAKGIVPINTKRSNARAWVQERNFINNPFPKLFSIFSN